MKPRRNTLGRGIPAAATVKLSLIEFPQPKPTIISAPEAKVTPAEHRDFLLLLARAQHRDALVADELAANHRQMSLSAQMAHSASAREARTVRRVCIAVALLAAAAVATILLH